jgi:hypothetical protein
MKLKLVRLNKALDVVFASDRGGRKNIGHVLDVEVNVDTLDTGPQGVTFKSRGKEILIPWSGVDYCEVLPDQAKLKGIA